MPRRDGEISQDEKKTVSFVKKLTVMELLGGFEPPTSSLPRMRSTD